MADNSADNGLSGVGGWLKLLVVLLTWVGPVLMTAALVWAVLLQLKLMGLKPLVLLGDAIMLWMAYFSFSAGRDLGGLKPGAVKKAKLFFEASMALVIAQTAYVVNYLFFSGIQSIPLLQILEAGVAAFMYLLAWHSYLSNSVRVRNTYG